VLGCRVHVSIIGKVRQVLPAQHEDAGELTPSESRRDLFSLALSTTHPDPSNRSTPTIALDADSDVRRG